MNCTEVLTLLPLHLTGELDAARAATLTAHLRECESCAAEAGRQAALDARLRESVAAETVDSMAVERRVRQRIAAEVPRPFAGALPWVFSAAACVAAIIVGFVVYRLTHPLTAPSDYTAAARDHHAEIVDRQPRKWQTDRVSIDKLAVQQKVPVSAIVTFSKDGFHLEQAKLCRLGLDKLPYLHLVYTNGAQRFSLYLRQEPAVSAHDSIDRADVGTDYVAAFRHGRLSAMVVTDQSEDAALHFARFAASVLERS